MRLSWNEVHARAAGFSEEGRVDCIFKEEFDRRMKKNIDAIMKRTAPKNRGMVPPDQAGGDLVEFQALLLALGEEAPHPVPSPARRSISRPLLALRAIPSFLSIVSRGEPSGSPARRAYRHSSLSSAGASRAASSSNNSASSTQLRL